MCKHTCARELSIPHAPISGVSRLRLPGHAFMSLACIRRASHKHTACKFSRSKLSRSQNCWLSCTHTLSSARTSSLSHSVHLTHPLTCILSISMRLLDCACKLLPSLLKLLLCSRTSSSPPPAPPVSLRPIVPPLLQLFSTPS